MSYRERRARLLPASLAMISRPGVKLPQLPAWAPMDRKPTEDDPHPEPYSDAERTARRQRLALYLAAEGPYDGQALNVMVAEGQPPPSEFVPADAPALRYVLDREDDTGVLLYRYDPTCQLHHRMVQAVEEAYAEADQQYAGLARADNTDAAGYHTRPQEA